MTTTAAASFRSFSSLNQNVLMASLLSQYVVAPVPICFCCFLEELLSNMALSDPIRSIEIGVKLTTLAMINDAPWLGRRRRKEGEQQQVLKKREMGGDQRWKGGGPSAHAMRIIGEQFQN